MKLHFNKLCHVMNNQTLKINLAASRESQRQQGYFDGRFVQRAVPDKTKYYRKRKHKNKTYE